MKGLTLPRAATLATRSRMINPARLRRGDRRKWRSVVEKEIELSVDKARSGETGHGVRYVLVIGTALTLLALLIVYWMA